MTERHVSTDSIPGREQDKAWASLALFEALSKLARTKHHARAVMVPLVAFIGNVRGIS